MQICLANLHFFRTCERSSKILSLEKTQKNLVFYSLIRIFAPKFIKVLTNYGRLPGGNF